MKKLAIALMCIVIALSLVAGAEGKSIIVDEERGYQFQRPNEAWKDEGGDKFNDYRFTRKSRIKKKPPWMWIGTREYSPDYPHYSKEDLDLSAIQHDWIRGMAEKYKLKNMKIIEEDFTVVDEHPAFWSITEYKVGKYNWREKVYLVEGDEFYYRLRFSCLKRYFGKHLEEFEQLVKSFKLL